MIHTVIVEITTHCDLRCPDCCAGVGINRTLQHHEWPYFERLAQFIRGVDRVHLTGGEPTFHPHFAEYVPRFRNLFGCRLLTMITNGWGVPKYKDILRQFDYIEYSDYHARPLARSTLVQIMGGRLPTFDGGVNASNFVPRSRRGSGQPCFRALEYSGTITYADGKFYGCCVAQGVDGSVGVEPDEFWFSRAYKLPCTDCFFSPGGTA